MRFSLSVLISFYSVGAFAFGGMERVNDESNDQMDVSYITGFSTGTVSVPQDGTQAGETFSVPGMPLLFNVNLDVYDSMTGFYQGGLLLDFSNSQVTRTGAAVGACYHLMGGSRKVKRGRIDGVLFDAHNPFNFSGCGKLAFQNYSASNVNNISERVQGSALETQIGMQYRQDISKELTAGVELYKSVFSVSASVDRLTSDNLEVLLFLRTFL